MGNEQAPVAQVAICAAEEEEIARAVRAAGKSSLALMKEGSTMMKENTPGAWAVVELATLLATNQIEELQTRDLLAQSKEDELAKAAEELLARIKHVTK